MSERHAAPRPADPRAANPRSPDPRTGTTDPRATEPRATEPRATEPRATDRRAASDDPRAAAAPPAAPPAAGGGAAPTALFSPHDLEAVTRRWHEIQAGFVDAPQQAVKDADALVQDLINRLADMFATERRQLETQWSRGDQVSTEDLRIALQRYRSFFQRLLAVH